ncbi:universal stress protein [Streptomyces sp. NPDC002767]
MHGQGSLGQARALVTGFRGRGGIGGSLLRSVSVAVAARAPCPVFVDRGGEQNRQGFGRVLGGAGTPPRPRKASTSRPSLDSHPAFRGPGRSPACGGGRACSGKGWNGTGHMQDPRHRGHRFAGPCSRVAGA